MLERQVIELNAYIVSLAENRMVGILESKKNNIKNILELAVLSKIVSDAITYEYIKNRDQLQSRSSAEVYRAAPSGSQSVKS